MDKNKLKKLVETLIVLKQKLKCAICLDVIQDISELNCGHKYCKSCFNEHKSTQKQPSCPLCKQIVKRRTTIYKDEYSNKLGKFVYDCCEEIRRVYKCEVEQLQKQFEADENLPLHDTGNIPLELEKVKKDVAVPSTSKGVTSKTKKLPKGKHIVGKINKKTTRTIDSYKENCEDAFDKLINTLPPETLNKRGTKHIYSNKNKSRKEPQFEYNILDFDNDANKALVLQWLQDTRNKFDRLSQTQKCESSENIEPSFDLVSISQVKRYSEGTKHVPVTCNKRAKSLNIEIKKAAPTQRRPQSHTGSVSVEDYNIEDINTEEEEVVKKAEEKVILHLLEDEYLNTLDNNLEETTDTVNSTRKKTEPKATTGWKRLTKMEKNIKKKERVPKQLNITLQSTQELKNERTTSQLSGRKKKIATVAPVTETSTRQKNPNTGTDKKVDGNEKVDIDNKSRPPEHQITNGQINKEKEVEVVHTDNARHTYDLKKLEDYISENIEIIEGNTSVDSDISFKLKDRTPYKKPATDKKVTGTQKSKLYKDKKKNEKHKTKEKFDVQKSHMAHQFEVDTHQVELDKQPKSLVKGAYHDIVETEVYKNESTVKKQPGYSKNYMDDGSSCILLDVPINTPTQKTTHKIDLKVTDENDIIVIDDDLPEGPKENLSSASNGDKNNVSEQDTSLDDEAKLYACATQKVNHTCTGSNPMELDTEKVDSMEDLIHLLDTCLDKCVTNLRSSDVLMENKLRNLQFFVSKLKSLIGKSNRSCNAQTQITVDVSNKNVQTMPNVEVTDQIIQTVNVDLTDKIIQTEISKNTVELQTENFNCIKCGIDLNENKVPSSTKSISQDKKVALEPVVDKTKMDVKPDLHRTFANKSNTPRTKDALPHDVFTCTLDNLNFETQEVTKNEGTITKVHSSENRTKEKATVTKDENIPGSLLVCSLNSSTSKSQSKVNPKLVYNGEKTNRFKRIRVPTPDSDSNDEVPAKVKCNRFIRDDLTIEFAASPDKSHVKNVQSNTTLDSQDSEGINYDDYLAEVMKKYDENNFPSEPSSVKKPDILTPKQVVIKKCEEMINNANNLKTTSGLSRTSSKDSFTTASGSVCHNLPDELDSDKIFMDEENLLKLENDIRQYEQENAVKGDNSEFSDIIVDTEEIAPLPKKPKLNYQKNKNLLSKNKEACVVLPNSPEVLNDDFDEVVTNLICTSKKQDISANKVTVISNIKVKSQDRDEKVNEGDAVFSDEDIVETTPRKQVHSFSERLMHSQNPINWINDALPTPLTETDKFDFDILPLPPPTAFRDDVVADRITPEAIADSDSEYNVTDEDDDTTQYNTTLTNLNKSLPRKNNASQLIIERSKTSQLSPIVQLNSESQCAFVQTSRNKYRNSEIIVEENLPKMLELPDLPNRNVTHSTPMVDVDLIKESLGFSPISSNKPHEIGIEEMVETTKHTPLATTARPPSQKQVLLTSTPKQKSMWNYVKPSIKIKPCLACTRLTKDQIKDVLQLTHLKLATYSPQFNSSVTHMIVTTNENNCVKDYTIKFISAVAAGIWVLSFEWVQECLKRDCIVPEELFEVRDISGLPGPRTSRLTRMHNPLFKGYKFFCAEPFVSTTRTEIEDVLKTLGGVVIRELKDLLEHDGNIGLIIAEAHVTQDFAQNERWIEEYKTVTVDIEWVSKCVGQYQILSIRPFIWCSEENLCDLGYPSILTKNVPFSFTETL